MGSGVVGYELIGICVIIDALILWIRLLWRPLPGRNGYNGVLIGVCNNKYEAIFKIVVFTIATIIELVGSPIMSHNWTNVDVVETVSNNLSHTNIYIAFVASGIVELLRQPFHISVKISHALLAHIYLLLCILVWPSHMLLDEKRIIEYNMMIVLGIIQFALAIMLSFKIYFNRTFILAILHVYLTFLQGTWLMQIGTIVHRYKWDGIILKQRKKLLKFIPPLIGMHILFCSIFLVVTYCITQKYRGRRLTAGYGILEMEDMDENEEEESSVSENSYDMNQPYFVHDLADFGGTSINNLNKMNEFPPENITPLAFSDSD